MPIETFGFVNSLNPANPASSDGLVGGDDHIRGIKAALVATFPNIGGAVTLTHTQLNALVGGGGGVTNLADGTATGPSIFFETEPTLGLYKAGAGKIGVSSGKKLVGGGAVPAGAIVDFPKVPSNFSSGGAALPNTDWLECDGSLYNIASFPDLGAFLGNTFGGNGTTTFAVPNLKDTGRFRRSRTNSVAAGTSQTQAIEAHTHTFTGSAGGQATTSESGSHGHSVNISDPGHSHGVGQSPHGHNFNGQQVSVINGSSGAGTIVWAAGGPDGGAIQTANANVSINGAATGISASAATVAGHTHTVNLGALSGTIGATGGTETRPHAFVCVTCIKT
jgi:microcystin-dependent protein